VAAPVPWEGIGKELQSGRKGGIGSHRLVEVEMSPRLYGALTTPRGRFLLVAAGTVLILGVATGGYILGRELHYLNIVARDNTIQRLRSDIQKLSAEITDQNGNLAALQTKLTSVQAALAAIRPLQNTYNVNPNESVIVADGHLTIGLISSPTNERVNINVNGKQQSAAVGDVIHVAVDPSMNCEVRVQSFDMFKAVLNASCAEVKPH